MKARSPRRYYHRHYVNVSTPRTERDPRDSAWSTAKWLGTAVALTGVIFSVVYVMN
ncbi:hypothetical protein OJ996_26260 [Luteolibacter sp. GHJ8]|jgi:hypothetical protein|uniref:Uncharacterized protein n=1 Tax=Luteolibacter rhizosphaerae TaxID=2989719 RepID=A0ABT3GBA1_9BACT|nr:hypothetical protein [Luteolibacter rhizosphaerae]MCW1917118.1 hypothetical protein [Luteolibacter rhizosphaerae]